LAIWVLLSANSWGILWSAIPFTLAFYSYIGTKLIFIPFIILAVILTCRKQKHHAISPYIVLILSCLVFTAGYLLLLKTSSTGSRISELLLPSSPSVASRVNEIRRTFIQSPLLPFFVNKYVIYFQIFFSKLFRIFSPAYLFVEGDQFFLPARQSFFYYADFLFMIAGTLFLFSRKRRYFFILSGFILIGILPHLLHVTMGDFSGHLALMFPFMILIIGTGIAGCVGRVKGHVRSIALGIVSIIYTLSIANFIMIYIFQYPLVGAGDFPLRVLFKYITLARQTHTPITVYSMRSGDLLTKYLFYSNAMTKDTLPEISRLHTQLPFTFNQINFTDCDSTVTRTNAPTGIVIYDQNCSMNIEEPSAKISSLLDGGQQYKIFHDPVCSGYNLNSYPAGITIRTLAIEPLPPAEFCYLYISH